MQSNEYQQLISFREECLAIRERKERSHLKQLLRGNQVTPRSYSAKKEQIERWVSLERAELEKTKQSYKEEWVKTVSLIEETQRNVDLMRGKINGDSNSFSQASSALGGGAPSGPLVRQQRSFLLDAGGAAERERGAPAGGGLPRSYRSNAAAGFEDISVDIVVSARRSARGVPSAGSAASRDRELPKGPSDPQKAVSRSEQKAQLMPDQDSSERRLLAQLESAGSLTDE